VWAREGGLDAHVTLADFYQELASALRFDPGLIDTLITLELALEEDVLRPTLQATDLLHEAERSNVQVVFTSDTYFPAAFIQRQLARKGLWPNHARCFSSSDLGVSKASGALFTTVAHELDVPASAIVHVGDNVESDVTSANRVGVRGRWSPDGRLNRYEQRLTAARWETAGMAAAFAGASRVARMRIPCSDVRSRVLRDVAAGVAAPFLSAYILWVFHRAKALGLTRLYFVARDGQVFTELATILNGRLNWNLDVRYLYASRQTVNLAAVYEGSASELRWVCRKGEHISLGSLLRRIDTELSEVAPAIASIWPGHIDASTRVTDDLRAILLAAMESGPLRELVLKKAATRRDGVTAYLRQEGLLDETSIGIVDIGGVGSQATALHRLCMRNGQPRPRFFFVGLDPYPDPSQAAANAGWLPDAECYIFDLQRKRGLSTFPGLITTVQMFCAADHGTVVRYERRGGRLEPVLETDSNPDLRAWGLPLVRNTLRQIVTEVVLDEELVDRAADLRPAVCDVIREFWTHPTTDEAHVWGAFPFEGMEMSSPAVKSLARPYRWFETMNAVVDGSFLRGSFPNRAWNNWHEAAVLLTPPLLRRSIRFVERILKSRHPRIRVWRSRARWLRDKFR